MDDLLTEEEAGVIGEEIARLEQEIDRLEKSREKGRKEGALKIDKKPNLTLSSLAWAIPYKS